MTGNKITTGLPQRMGDGEQDGDGGITVRLMSDLTIHLLDRTGNYAISMPMFLAMDVGQRLIQMAATATQMHIKDLMGAPQVTEAAPKIEIIKGRLPKDFAG